jgi:hypothetical protein
MDWVEISRGTELLLNKLDYGVGNEALLFRTFFACSRCS